MGWTSFGKASYGVWDSRKKNRGRGANSADAWYQRTQNTVHTAASDSNKLDDHLYRHGYNIRICLSFDRLLQVLSKKSFPPFLSASKVVDLWRSAFRDLPMRSIADIYPPRSPLTINVVVWYSVFVRILVVFVIREVMLLEHIQPLIQLLGGSR